MRISKYFTDCLFLCITILFFFFFGFFLNSSKMKVLKLPEDRNNDREELDDTLSDLNNTLSEMFADDSLIDPIFDDIEDQNDTDKEEEEEEEKSELSDLSDFSEEEEEEEEDDEGPPEKHAR